MSIENTKFIVDITESSEANDYLKLGWVLISQYVRAYGSPTALD